MVNTSQFSGEPGSELAAGESDPPLLFNGGLLAKAFGKALKQHERHKENTIGSSASLRKKKREEDENTQNNRTRAKIRRKIYSRGRKVVPDVGTNPALDQEERELRRIAARGVVRFFNMVSKFNKPGSTKGKANGEMTKEFLAEMKKPLSTEKHSEKPVKTWKNTSEAKKASWSALHDSFTGVDDEAVEEWNKEASGESEDEEPDDDHEQLEESSGSDSEKEGLSDDVMSDESDEKNASDDS